MKYVQCMGLDSVDLHCSLATLEDRSSATQSSRSGIARISSLHTVDGIVYWSFEVASGQVV